MTASYERYLGCAAFHPTNDNIVFLFGGHDENGNRMPNAFKVHLDDGTHHNLKDLDYSLSYHACLGFVKDDGRPVSFVFYSGGHFCCNSSKVPPTFWLFQSIFKKNPATNEISFESPNIQLLVSEIKLGVASLW